MHGNNIIINDNVIESTEEDPTVPNLVKSITNQNIEDWNNKYTKPNTGIPKTDLSQDVQDLLDIPVLFNKHLNFRITTEGTRRQANAWYQEGYTYYTGILPKGKYLFLIGYQFVGTNVSGLVTGRLKIDDMDRGGRVTIPLSGNYYLSGCGFTIVDFDTESDHSLKYEGYGSVDWKDGNNVNLDIIRLSDYIPTRNSSEEFLMGDLAEYIEPKEIER